MRRNRLLLALLGIYFGIFGIYLGYAQSGGQFCVRSFEDRNENGILDNTNEPLLTRGVSVELLDSANVVIASGLLDRSQEASSGIICFQNLTDGTYSVLISSADFQATTSNLVTRNISATGLPVVVEYGGVRSTNTVSNNTATPNANAGMTPDQMESFIVRLTFAGVGAVVIAVFMLLVGFIIYWTRMRSSEPKPVSYNPGSVRRMEEVGNYPPPIPEPPISDDDTGKNQSISMDI